MLMTYINEDDQDAHSSIDGDADEDSDEKPKL